jgi:hypothetical protein
MKRFLMLVGVAVVAAAMYVAASPASQQSKPKAPTAKQFNALKKQVASLSKSLKALKADETTVKSEATDAVAFIATCLTSDGAGIVPVDQFGTSTNGFLFGTSTSSVPRTALDVDTSPTPGALLLAVDPTCVAPSGAAHLGSSHLLLRALRAH